MPLRYCPCRSPEARTASHPPLEYQCAFLFATAVHSTHYITAPAGPHAPTAGFKEAFGSQRLLLGGPVHLDHVTLLHRYMGIARSHKIAEGMYMGEPQRTRTRTCPYKASRRCSGCTRASCIRCCEHGPHFTERVKVHVRILLAPCTGGLPDAIRLINAGIAQPSDFLLVLGEQLRWTMITMLVLRGMCSWSRGRVSCQWQLH